MAHQIQPCTISYFQKTRVTSSSDRGYVGDLHRSICGLEFTYQGEENPHRLQTVSFGKRQGVEIRFPIDGPGGEYITALHITTMESTIVGPILSVRLPSFPTLNTLLSFRTHKLTKDAAVHQSNRTRWFCYERFFTMPKDLLLEAHYTPGPGEYITGLMWASGGVGDSLDYFWNFGIMCRSVTCK